MHPGIRLDKREEAAQLYKAISKLKEEQRVAFTMFYIEDIPQKQIAEIMNISLSKVETLIFRAKQKLKKDLTENE